MQISLQTSQYARGWVFLGPKLVARSKHPSKRPGVIVHHKQPLLTKSYSSTSRGAVLHQNGNTKAAARHIPLSGLKFSFRQTAKFCSQTNHERCMEQIALCSPTSVAEGCNEHPNCLFPSKEYELRSQSSVASE